MADEAAELVTVTLTAKDWARLREYLETFAAYAEIHAGQVAVLLQRHAGDGEHLTRRTTWRRDQANSLALAQDARRLNTAVGRRVDARTGKG